LKKDAASPPSAHDDLRAQIYFECADIAASCLTEARPRRLFDAEFAAARRGGRRVAEVELLPGITPGCQLLIPET
jgi:hypothetical protein